MYFVHPLTDISVDISTDSRHIGRVSVDMSTNISVESRSRCVSRHIDRHIGQASVDMLTDT